MFVLKRPTPKSLWNCQGAGRMLKQTKYKHRFKKGYEIGEWEIEDDKMGVREK